MYTRVVHSTDTQEHGGVCQVACEAAAALANLARNAENRRAMVEGGAVGASLALAVSSHGETARQATRTLCNLSLSPELRDTLVQVRLAMSHMVLSG